jgi:hypothetical protein
MTMATGDFWKLVGINVGPSFSMVIITFFIAGGFLGLLVTVSFPELVAVVEKMPEV